MTIGRERELPHEPRDEIVDDLIALVYELLDAHADTARLDSDETTAAEWSSHLAYLRDLQRVGRETVARAASQPVPSAARGDELRRWQSSDPTRGRN